MTPDATKNRPNVLILMMDATRATRLSCYGYPKATTPNLDQLAAQGVLYEQAIAPAPWTLESTASLFTGLYPSQHGTNFDHQFLEPQFTTLAEMLTAHDYQTALFGTVEWISDLFGMTRGFQSRTNYAQGLPWLRRYFKKTTKFEKALRYIRWTLYSNRYGKMTHEALHDMRRWFQQTHQANRPFFVMAHLADPHWPWYFHPKTTQVSGPKRPRILAPDAHRFIAGEVSFSEADLTLMNEYYDGEIRFLDDYLGKALGWLEANGHLEDTIVLVFSDHGEEIGDHGLLGHGWSVYEPELRVPMIIHHPTYFTGGQRITEPVQSVDVFPTVMELAGVDRGTVPNPLFGRSLLPDKVRANPRPFTISERLAPSVRRFERLMPNFDTTRIKRQLRGLRQRGPGYKLIWGSDGKHELYNLAHDPHELTDLAEREPEQLKALLAQLQQWQDSLGAVSFGQLQPEMEEVLKERLKDLGYL